MRILFQKIILLVIATTLLVIFLPRKSLPIGLHYSLNATPDFFDVAYKNVSPARPADKITGITVNHHLLAPHLIAQELNLVATDQSVNVVLLSPNHFFRGAGPIITSRFDWQTPYGVLATNQSLVDKLVDTGLVNADETPFYQEHGVSGIVGFIKKSVPNAKFTAIVIKDNATDETVDALAKQLAEILPTNSLIVGSLDFSHYLPSNGAKFHDAQTLAAIHNFDFGRLKLLDVDSHAALRLMLKYFDLKGEKKFVVTSHENSSTVTGNYSFVETTSYINGYFTAGTNEHDNAHTVLYVQGLSPEDHWQIDASERLYKFNDRVVTQKPIELTPLKLAPGPLAVGLVYNPNLTDVYLFPLAIANHMITLRPQANPDIMHLQFK